MNKILILLLVSSLRLSAINPSQFKISLKPEQKLQSTFSGQLSDECSLHLAVTKNKKNSSYEIIPVYMNKDKESRQFDSFNFIKNPRLLSYHQHNGLLTLLYITEETLFIVDINLVSGTNKIHQKNAIGGFPDIFRLEDKTVLLHHDYKKNIITVSSITSGDAIDIKEINIPVEIENEVKVAYDESTAVVNQIEYVKNGPIVNSKAYYMGGKIYITYFNEKDFAPSRAANATNPKITTKVLIIDANSENPIKHREIQSPIIVQTKDGNSFLKDSTLFFLTLNKGNLLLSIVNTDSGETLSSLTLENELKVILEGTSKENFLKKGARSGYHPTVTVNETIKGNYEVNVDLVNIQTYSYHHDWWFSHWMFQQQMFQQQMMRENVPTLRFTPSMPADYFYSEDENIGFKFFLNKNMGIIEGTDDSPVYKDVNKEKYLDKLKNSIQMKYPTACFMDNGFRYIYQNRQNGDIYVLASSY